MVVVVGTTGFLGSRLAEALERDGPIARVGGRCESPETISIDLRSDDDLRRVCDLAKGSVVYYCANVGGRRAAQADPAAAYRVNVHAPARIAAAAHQFTYFSSDYVFSKPGLCTENTMVSPQGVYAHSKVDGEREVLKASSRSLVVRVSGLFDVACTRTHTFRKIGAIAAPDDRVASPTYVPDLPGVIQAWQRQGASGIRHLCGPDALSEYEFLQLASLRWGFRVRPVLSSDPRSRVLMTPSAGGATRGTAAAFCEAPYAQGREYLPILLFDCVGAILGARRWREPDVCFWDRVDREPERALHEYGAERLADAFCPNPRLWPAIRAVRSTRRLILANNGPWASFSLWQRKYGFASVFDAVLNSERDGLVKATPEFRKHIANVARGQHVCLIDDQAEIVADGAREGWDSRRTSRLAAWPVDEYACEGSDTLCAELP